MKRLVTFFAREEVSIHFRKPRCWERNRKKRRIIPYALRFGPPQQSLRLARLAIEPGNLRRLVGAPNAQFIHAAQRGEYARVPGSGRTVVGLKRSGQMASGIGIRFG